jgi:multiple sugar transport system permease protein
MAATPTTLDTTAIKERAGRGFGPGNVIAMAFLFVATIYFLLPLYWLFVASTKDAGDLFGTFGLWFSGHWNLWTNLSKLFTYDGHIYVRWLVNSFVYAGISAIIGTGLSMMAGYALAKYTFRGRNLIFSIILGAILVPSTALALPLYLLMSQWGLTNTYWAVLLPSLVNPFGVYLSRIYAAGSVPDELLDAARVDGSGEFRTFVTVALRIMSPALVTIFLFQFVAVWQNFFLPLVMLSDTNLYPITVGLQVWNTTTGGGQQFLYSLIVTGSLVSIIPLIIGFLFLQRYWRGGLTAGSVKA